MSDPKSKIRAMLPSFYADYLDTLRGLSEDELRMILDGAGINFEYDKPPINNLEVKSVWQNAGGKWLTSWKSETGGGKETWKEIREETLTDLKKFRPKQPKIKRKKGLSKKLHLLSISDIHFGKETIGKTKDRVHSVVDELLSRLDNKKDKQFLYIIGNDILNTDHDQKTTAGTQQFDFMEPKEVFREAWQTTIEVIEKLLTLGTVHLIHVPSNHDRYRGSYLFDVVWNRFYNNSNVTYEKSLDDRQYYRFGNNAYMFEHGELKINDYEIIFATEAPSIYCNTKHREVILGHLHHEQVHQRRGCRIRVLSSISASDKWHKRKGYISPSQQQLLVYDYDKGLETIHEITV